MKGLMTSLCLSMAVVACDGSGGGGDEREKEGVERHTQVKGIAFFHGSLEDGLARAKAEDKLVFVDAYTTWCGPCKMMVLNVFPQEKVGNFYNANFISLKVDIEDEDQNGPELKERYDISVLPTYLYLDHDGEVMHKTTGFIAAERFIVAGKEAMGEEYNVFADLDKRYQEGERAPAFIREYLAEASYAAPGDVMSQENQAHQLRMKKVFDEYIGSKDKTSLINSADFALMESYLDRAHADRDDEYVDYVARNYDAFIKVAPESRVALFLLDAVKRSVGGTARSGDAGYVKYIEELDGLLAPAYKCQLEVIKNRYVYREYLEKLGKMHYEQATMDWGQLLSAAEAEIATKGEAMTGQDYGRLASQFGQCDDVEILKKVLVFARKSHEMDPSARVAMSYIGFLRTLGQNDKAIEIAEQTLASIDEDSGDAGLTMRLTQMLTRLKAR